MIETENHSWKRVPDVILRDNRLKGSDIAIFACLLDLCKDTLRISVSCKEIANRTNRSRKTVVLSLATLEKYGYIERKVASGTISTYFLAEIVPPEKKRKLKSQTPVSSSCNKEKEKKRYGSYQHVALTVQEYSTLRARYGEKILMIYIQKIDDYCELYGKSYENYYLAIKKWIEGDEQKNPKDFEKQKSKLTDEKLAGYLSLVNRFQDD